MNSEELIAALEREWDIDGFLEMLRRGSFDEAGGDRLIRILLSFRPDQDRRVPLRLVSLVWYIPIFLVWQEDRVRESGGDAKKLKDFQMSIQRALEEAFGYP